jgi:hypothetical protein
MAFLSTKVVKLATYRRRRRQKTIDPVWKECRALLLRQMRREGVPAEIRTKALAWFQTEVFEKFKVPSVNCALALPGHLSNGEVAAIGRQLRKLESAFAAQDATRREMQIQLLRVKLTQLLSEVK